jgi:glutamyl-tRNA reductase
MKVSELIDKMIGEAITLQFQLNYIGDYDVIIHAGTEDDDLVIPIQVQEVYANHETKQVIILVDL